MNVDYLSYLSNHENLGCYLICELSMAIGTVRLIRGRSHEYPSF